MKPTSSLCVQIFVQDSISFTRCYPGLFLLSIYRKREKKCTSTNHKQLNSLCFNSEMLALGQFGIGASSWLFLQLKTALLFRILICIK